MEKKAKKRLDLDKIGMSICLGCNGNGFLLRALTAGLFARNVRALAL
jgi:hypothetical protein